MFNKTIAIAALCSAATANTTTTSSTTSTTTSTTTTPKTTTASTTATKAAAATTVAAVVHNLEAKTGGTVLCDQGDSGIWKEADAALTKLKLAAATAATNLANAKTPYDKQVKEVGLMETAKNNHASENATYATALSDAKKAKDDWALKAGVTIATADGSAAKLALLNTEKKKTEDAGKLVDAQLARVEKLVEAKRAQDKEEAKWEERRAASAALAAGIQKELDVATAWETKLKETFTTRSFLFQMLGKPIDQRQLQTDWKTGCAFGPDSGSQSCELMEKGTASKSAPITFWWGICYNNVTQNTANPNSNTNKVCAPHGLDDDAATSSPNNDGLISVASAQTGVQNDTTGGSNTATQLFKVYEAANYEYSAGTTKLSAALTAYKAWQEKEILAEMFWMGCWTGASNTNTVQQSDFDTNCKDTAGFGRYNVWIQYHMEAETINKATVGAAAKRLAFDQSTKAANGTVTYANDTAGKYTAGTWKHISDNEIMVAAEALASIWIQGWVIAALTLERVAVGKPADKTTRSLTWSSSNKAQFIALGCDETNFASGAGCKWSDSLLGKAEVDVAAKTLNKTINTNETAAMTAYKALATAEEVAVGKDLVRARALLTTLTNDIAPLARKEFAAQAAYDAALKKEADKAEAVAQLGAATTTVGQTTTPATGAYAVLEAAQVAVDSVAEQQKFHDERWHWAKDVLAPLKKTYDLAVTADANAKAAVVTATARLSATAAACKVAAFGVAQTAYSDKLAYDAGLAAIQASVKKAYAAKANFPASGKGALCNYKKPASATAEKGERLQIEKCKDDQDTLCCGAAQRFLKDGTKMTIETCQEKKSTTYLYYPALPAGALVQPTPETWRFSCISAARKLAAVATAALATGYMMA